MPSYDGPIAGIGFLFDDHGRRLPFPSFGLIHRTDRSHRVREARGHVYFIDDRHVATDPLLLGQGRGFRKTTSLLSHVLWWWLRYGNRLRVGWIDQDFLEKGQANQPILIPIRLLPEEADKIGYPLYLRIWLSYEISDVEQFLSHLVETRRSEVGCLEIEQDLREFIRRFLESEIVKGENEYRRGQNSLELMRTRRDLAIELVNPPRPRAKVEIHGSVKSKLGIDLPQLELAGSIDDYSTNLAALYFEMYRDGQEEADSFLALLSRWLRSERHLPSIVLEKLCPQLAGDPDLAGPQSNDVVVAPSSQGGSAFTPAIWLWRIRTFSWMTAVVLVLIAFGLDRLPISPSEFENYESPWDAFWNIAPTLHNLIELAQNVLTVVFFMLSSVVMAIVFILVDIKQKASEKQRFPDAEAARARRMQVLQTQAIPSKKNHTRDVQRMTLEANLLRWLYNFGNDTYHREVKKLIDMHGCVVSFMMYGQEHTGPTIRVRQHGNGPATLSYVPLTNMDLGAKGEGAWEKPILIQLKHAGRLKDGQESTDSILEVYPARRSWCDEVASHTLSLNVDRPSANSGGNRVHLSLSHIRSMRFLDTLPDETVYKSLKRRYRIIWILDASLAANDKEAIRGALMQVFEVSSGTLAQDIDHQILLCTDIEHIEHGPRNIAVTRQDAVYSLRMKKREAVCDLVDTFGSVDLESQLGHFVDKNSFPVNDFELPWECALERAKEICTTESSPSMKHLVVLIGGLGPHRHLDVKEWNEFWRPSPHNEKKDDVLQNANVYQLWYKRRRDYDRYAIDPELDWHRVLSELRNNKSGVLAVEGVRCQHPFESDQDRIGHLQGLYDEFWEAVNAERRSNLSELASALRDKINTDMNDVAEQVAESASPFLVPFVNGRKSYEGV